MRKTLSLLLITCSAMCLPLHAIEVDENALKNNRLFGIELPTNLQSFYGRHDRINSVSLQEYMAGPYSVTEVTIDMTGSPVQLRIYHTELATTDQATNAAPERVASQAAKIPPEVQKLIDRGRNETNDFSPPVIKDYPTTTHAKTIEFRVSKKKELEGFYREFVSAFTQSSMNDGEDSDSSDSEGPHRLAGTIFRIE